MTEELITLDIRFYSWSGDDPSDFSSMEKFLREHVPEGVSLDRQRPPIKKPDYKVPLTEETLEEYLLERFSPETFRQMGREYGDLSGFSREELRAMAIAFEHGGGGSGPMWEYVYNLLTSDTSTTIAAIGAIAVIAKELVV